MRMILYVENRLEAHQSWSVMTFFTSFTICRESIRNTEYDVHEHHKITCPSKML
jgi:hypothetical protein